MLSFPFNVTERNGAATQSVPDYVDVDLLPTIDVTNWAYAETRRRRRKKRETLVDDYHVEIRFVLDHTIWER